MSNYPSSNCRGATPPTSPGLLKGAARPPSLRLSGEIHGSDLGLVNDAIARMDKRVGQRVVLDLSRVTSWSIIAQAGVLSAARDLAARHCQLVLVGASPDLRQQGKGLDVVNKVHSLAFKDKGSWAAN
jgi:anti-anti-sigma regulatory factor